MRRLTFIIIFLVGAAGVFQWLSQGFASSWEPRLRFYLEDVASKATRADVHIDSITLGFFHRVRLLNVRALDPHDPDHPIFQASDIELTISLIDLPRAILHRKAYEAIGLVSIKNPWIRLSKETLARHVPRSEGKKSLPPWFTLAWKGGTFQWLDPRAPRGSWTLYQAQGVFRIRGPQMNFAIRGSIQEAQALRFQFSSLGQRWSAQLYVTTGILQSFRALAETWTQRSILPVEWFLRGGFDFEAHASGRAWPLHPDDWRRYIDLAILKFIPQEKDPKSKEPSLGFAGTLTYKKNTITSSNLSFDSPWLEGAGRAEVSLEGNRENPEMVLHANLPSGRLGRWTFQEAVIQGRYANTHWEFLQNTFRFLDGHASVKGTVARGGSDLSMTLESVSIAAMGREHGFKIPDGRLNASCALTGPFDDWQIAGSWWLSGMQWGEFPIGETRGDFEFSKTDFQAQAKSENSRFRFALEGNQSDKKVELDRMEISLPSGALLKASGRLMRATRQIQGNLDAGQLRFPSDLPFLTLGSLSPKGPLDVQVKISGTAAEPVLNGTLQSANFEHGSLDGKFYIQHRPHLGGNGSFKLKNATLGSWQNVQAALSFDLQPDYLQVSELSIDAEPAVLRWKGKASWAKDKGPLGQLLLQGAGDIRSAADPDAWHIPFDVSGQWESDGNGRKGRARIQAPRPLIRKKPMDPFEVDLAWDPTQLSWQGAHLGRRWKSHGTLRWENDSTAWSGIVEADRVPLAEWQPLLWPRLKDELRGYLSGALQLSGTSADPVRELSFHVDEGEWRAFRFSADLGGAWRNDGIQPLTLKGRFKTGGDFEFSGLVTHAGQAQGTVKLDRFNLRPLGESLRFPKTLDGTTTATLTLSGPLARLKWNGHIEGGPLVYSPESDHPFKLEKMVMDMTLAPLENDPSINHLTLTEAEVKTREELVRFRPGSFIEFAEDKPARLSVGAQIRNLHLGVFTLFGGLDVDGTWQIKPAGFALQTKSQTHSLFINDYELEEGLVLADYYNGILKFPAPPNAPPLITGTIDFHSAPQLKFTNFFITGKDEQGVELSGDVGPALWDFQVAGKGLDVGILGELAGFPYTLSGAADVQVHGAGDPKHPHVEGKVDLDRGTVLGLVFRSGSAAFIWQEGRITFTKLLLNDPGHYNLEGAGVFPLRPKSEVQSTALEAPLGRIDFSARLRDSNLSLLQSMSQEVKQARGAVEGLIQIKGTLDDPSLHGSLRVINGDILGAHYFRQLRNANLAVDFEGDTITVREFRGKSGEGEFRGSGTIGLAGFKPSKYDLSLEVISSKGVDVQVPELAIPESPLAKRFKFLTTASRSDVKGHVKLRGPAEAPIFSGVGIFSNGHFTFPPSRKNPPSAAILEWFHRITWEVDLKFQDGAWFENELVQANVIGNLALRGPSDRLRVDGGLDIPEGKISYLGLQFDIQQARYDIRSEQNGEAIVNTPYLRGAAESQVQAVDTVTGASGGSRLSTNDVITLNIDYAPVDLIKPRLTSASNPTLSQEKVLARVTKTDVENLTPQERTYLYQKQIVSLIDSTLTTPLAQNVLKKTGIADRLRVQHVFDPNTVTGQDLNTTGSAAQQQSTAVNLLANTKYTVEKDLSNRLSFGYGVRLVPSAVVDPVAQQQKLDLVSDVQLSYRWFRNVYLKGDFELPNSNPNFLPERKGMIEQRWRFGWWGNTNQDKAKSSK